MQAAAKDEDDANACFVYSNLRPKNTRSFMQARSVIKKTVFVSGSQCVHILRKVRVKTERCFPGMIVDIAGEACLLAPIPRFLNESCDAKSE